jgi:hypothetical protein
MDPKYVRKTVENLLAELERNPAIGRRPSPSFMGRYGRPLGLGIALGVSGVAGCDSDALPQRADAYGVADVGPLPKMDAPPLTIDASDAGAREVSAEAMDVLPGPVDVYGGPADVPPMVDTRDALPNDVPVYGVDVGRGIDTQDAPPVSDTQDAQPQSAEVSREVQPE